MASVEFIQKRIDGKKAEIQKLEAKMARIEKAKASNYEENNPYYYSDYDFRSTTRELELAKTALADWESKLSEENNKAASRDVPAINEFLDQWERRCIEFYLDAYQKYIIAKGEMRDEYRRMGEELEELGRRAQWDKEDPNYEAYHELDKKREKMWKDFHKDWNYVIQFLDHSKPYEEYMRHIVAEEKKRKYDFLVERICAIVGTITDATNLRVGQKGDLNGYIIGTDGEATVETIGAGGYNDNIILDSGRHGQIFHYRTIIKRRK